MAYEWITDDILRYLQRYGVSYVEWEGWRERAAYGPASRHFTPVGLVNHHTAGTDWYNPERLLTKCNFYIRPDGTVFVLSAGHQADSGMGDPNVLGRVRNDMPPQPPRDYTSSDRINGNQWFVDIEVGHWGMGEPIPEVQRDALIKLNAAICDYYDWRPEYRLIGHKEWTRRKVDPRWEYDGQPDLMEYIRRDTVELLDNTREAIIMEYLKADLHAMVDAAFEVGGAEGNEAWWHNDFIDKLEDFTPDAVRNELKYLYRELFD